MARTHLILDGLQDPLMAQRLSATWSEYGFDNAVDVAGQCGWVARGKKAESHAALTETEVDRAAAIARLFGVEVRDRVGATFIPENDLAALRKQAAYEYKSRTATALVFGLPALLLHYVSPILAPGSGSITRSMAYPWLFEFLLVGWACLAAGWPILWQGMLAAIGLRMTGDLLTSLIVLAAFVPSALGLGSMAWRPLPWFDMAQTGPMFHAAMLVMFLAVLQRWLVHRLSEKLSGRATLMMPGFGRFAFLWLVTSVVVGCVTRNWSMGLAVAMLLPPLISLGAINRWSPGWSMALPVAGFAMFLVMAPRWIGRSAAGVEIETAAGFQLVMIGVMAAGWGRLKPLNPRVEVK
ncbi:MAG: hypothetical protein K8S99_06850 [Planctomycetes bacterium]|nr:hypothetical protein [Planctomycetota bacterium]